MSDIPREVPNTSRDMADNFATAVSQLKQAVAENSRMLDAIIKHLKVPYDKLPSDFINDRIARDLTQFR